MSSELIGEAMGTVQHHDGVSGTEKQEVAFDYAQRLSDGIHAAVVSKPIYFLEQHTLLFCVFTWMFRT